MRYMRSCRLAAGRNEVTDILRGGGHMVVPYGGKAGWQGGGSGKMLYFVNEKM